MRPPTGQRVQRGGKGAAQRVQFVVDRDPQRLEGALGRMPAGAPGRSRNRLVQQGYQLCGRGERGAGALANDLRGDAACEPLLAVAVQDVRQRRLVVGVDDVGRGQR